MKTRIVHICVSKSDVFGRVRVKASYLAGKSIMQKGAGAYDQIEIADEDMILIGRYWKEACASLGSVIDDYAEMTEIGDARYAAVLRMPMNFDDRKESVINEQSAEYLVNEILAKWYAVSSKDDAEYQFALSAEILRGIEASLASRLRPMRRERVCRDLEYVELTEEEDSL